MIADHEMADVRALHEKFGLLHNDKPTYIDDNTLILRHNFLDEELKEFRVAVMGGDFVGIVDALIDIVYVAKGTAVMLGIPWTELWNDVQRANMEKKKIEPTPTDHHGGLVKPLGWSPPYTEEILRRAGWDPSK